MACEENRVCLVDQVSLGDTRDPVNASNIKNARSIEAPGSQDFHGALKLVLLQNFRAQRDVEP